LPLEKPIPSGLLQTAFLNAGRILTQSSEKVYIFKAGTGHMSLHCANYVHHERLTDSQDAKYNIPGKAETDAKHTYILTGNATHWDHLFLAMLDGNDHSKNVGGYLNFER
jgi:hypothetical protein